MLPCCGLLAWQKSIWIFSGSTEANSCQNHPRAPVEFQPEPEIERRALEKTKVLLGIEGCPYA